MFDEQKRALSYSARCFGGLGNFDSFGRFRRPTKAIGFFHVFFT